MSEKKRIASMNLRALRALRARRARRALRGSNNYPGLVRNYFFLPRRTRKTRRWA